MACSSVFERIRRRLSRPAWLRLRPPAPDSRWCPGQWVRGMRNGWVLADGERRVGADVDGVDLVSLVIRPPTTLTLSVIVGEDAHRTLEFPGLSELPVDGQLQHGMTDCVWDVLCTAMLVADQPRAEGRVVYMLELPTALMSFASFPATQQISRLRLLR